MKTMDADLLIFFLESRHACSRTAELKLGATLKNIDNPSLPERNRKTKSVDFDEKINLNVNGKVGDKVNMNLNYNTDATFDFDTKNLKLRYPEGGLPVP